MIECARCGKQKPEASFAKKKGKGLSKRCAECRKYYQDAVTRWKERQDAPRAVVKVDPIQCGICRSKVSQAHRQVNHYKGKICTECNKILVAAGNDENLLREALKFLQGQPTD